MATESTSLPCGRRSVLAAAQHHSAPKGAGPVTYEASRGQMTARAVGARPAPLAEVAEPQEVEAASACAAGGPSLAPAGLGGGGDAVDAAALAFLLDQNLRLQEEDEERREEEERQRSELEEVELDELLAENYAQLRLWSLRAPGQEARLKAVTRWRAMISSSRAARKEKKKRRKRKRKTTSCAFSSSYPPSSWRSRLLC